MPASVAKYLSIRSGSMPEKPRSIMRLTASGTASVARGRDESASSAAAEHPLVAQEIRPQARAAGASEARLPPPALPRRRESARGGRGRPVCGVTSCTNNGPSSFVQAQTLRARAARRKGLDAAPIRRSLVPRRKFRYRLGANQIRRFPKAGAMKKDIHPEYHRIKVVMTDGTEFDDLFDLWRRGRHAEARHRSQDASGLDRRQPASDRPRRPAVPLQAEIRRLHQIAALPRSLGTFTRPRLPNAARKRESCVLSGLSASAHRRQLLVPEHLIEPDHPLLQLDALLDQLAQPGRQRAEIARSAARRPVAGSLILRCSSTACSGVSSPSLTARRIRSHEASCISRVVSRMLSVA